MDLHLIEGSHLLRLEQMGDGLHPGENKYRLGA
jgi:hypothetical protein